MTQLFQINIDFIKNGLKIGHAIEDSIKQEY